jgi:hypothetical protein
MEIIKQRISEILNSDELLMLFEEIKNVAMNVDKLIEDSEKDEVLQNDNDYQDMIDEFQDELLGMILELFDIKKQENDKMEEQ